MNFTEEVDFSLSGGLEIPRHVPRHYSTDLNSHTTNEREEWSQGSKPTTAWFQELESPEIPHGRLAGGINWTGLRSNFSGGMIPCPRRVDIQKPYSKSMYKTKLRWQSVEVSLPSPSSPVFSTVNAIVICFPESFHSPNKQSSSFPLITMPG